MPVATDETTEGSFKTVLDSLDYAKDKELLPEDEAVFLKNVLGDPIVRQLVKAQEALDPQHDTTTKQDNIELCKELLTDLEPRSKDDDRVDELFKIMEGVTFRSLVDAHDAVLSKAYETPPSSPSILPYDDDNQSPRGGDPLRVVGLHKGAGESLGVILSLDEKGNIFIAKIVKGSMIDRQGLLHAGDIIKAVNGDKVGKDPRQIEENLKDYAGSVTLRVIPSYKDHHGSSQMFVKAHYDYDPAKDSLVPRDETGLPFEKGDILEIIDRSDTNWWHARSDEGRKAGIIPSQMLEENRRSQITPAHKESRNIFCGGSRMKKRKMMYTSKKNAAFDRLDMAIYEEVTKMPPFERKVLVLIGPPRVGRRTLKNKLIKNDPEKFGSTIPHTSRKPRKDEENGKGYYFANREQMHTDIDEGKYLEWGDFEDNYYGTKLDTVRNVMRSGKTCILDVNPTALKMLKTAEFMPFVVFIASPKLESLKEINKSRVGSKKFTDKELQETVEESRKLFNLYSHYFDLTLVNDDFDETYNKLREKFLKLSTETQWVPVNWVY